jgi:hypothetical protein
MGLLVGAVGAEGREVGRRATPQTERFTALDAIFGRGYAAQPWGMGALAAALGGLAGIAVGIGECAFREPTALHTTPPPTSSPQSAPVCTLIAPCGNKLCTSILFHDCPPHAC